MGWTIAVPVKAAAGRKSRLAPDVAPDDRIELSSELFRHVARCIFESGVAEQIIGISSDLPEVGVPVRRWPQQDPDLNAELERVRQASAGSFMVINADLPLLQPGDVIALATKADERGCAIAPDRHGIGTNAVALLRDAPFEFHFGSGSLSLHLRSAPQAAQVERAGLAFDLDTMADLRAIAELARPLPSYLARLLPAQPLKGTRAAVAAGD